MTLARGPATRWRSRPSLAASRCSSSLADRGRRCWPSVIRDRRSRARVAVRRRHARAGGTPVQLDTTLYLPEHDPGAGGPAGARLRRLQDRPGRRGPHAGPARLRRADLHRPRLRRVRRPDPPRLPPTTRWPTRSLLLDYLRPCQRCAQDGRRSRSRGGRLVLRRRRWRCCWPPPTTGSSAVAADITWNDLARAASRTPPAPARPGRVQEAVGRLPVRQRRSADRPSDGRLGAVTGDGPRRPPTGSRAAALRPVRRRRLRGLPGLGRGRRRRPRRCRAAHARGQPGHRARHASTRRPC